jgi:hypothetical protein
MERRRELRLPLARQPCSHSRSSNRCETPRPVRALNAQRAVLHEPLGEGSLFCSIVCARARSLAHSLA